MAARTLAHLLCLGLVSALTGCNCGRLSGEAGEVSFKRCLRDDPPEARRFRAGALSLELEARRLSITATSDVLRVIAFTGPVGAALTRAELTQISEASPDLVLMLGGLGDDEKQASATLAGLAALAVPTLFLAGGTDRLELVEDAFDALEGPARDLVLNITALRELQVAGQSFVVVAGAPLGRYALDEESCGFDGDDLDDVAAAFEGRDVASPWLLSWAAPVGWGLTRGLGNTDVGSAELAELARELKVAGGLFAFPESAVAREKRAPSGSGFAMVVPRLGRTGATRTHGGRVPGTVAVLKLGASGLALATAKP